MAATVLSLWNQALAALGTESTVAAVNEVSREAEVCNLWYETARDTVFRAAPWSCLSGFSRLATLVVRDDTVDWVSTDPPPGWLYAFALPSDCVRPRHLSSFGTFILSMVEDTPIIACNEDVPILHYTRRFDRIDLWDVDLFGAVTFSLAAHIAKGITGNDSDLRNMFAIASDKIGAARANNANINSQPLESIPDWLSARGQAISSPTSRYFYPSAEFTVQGFNNLG